MFCTSWCPDFEFRGTLGFCEDEFRAIEPVAAGEEVFLCYGQHSNWQLLHQYGFALRKNALDRLPLDPEELCRSSAAHTPPPPARPPSLALRSSAGLLTVTGRLCSACDGCVLSRWQRR